MVETKKRKAIITEEDMSLLLQKYTVTSILALLQEVSQVAGSKIDWNMLVKKTSTGITCPSEYQMLWRHLAYRDILVDKLEENAEPLDDDSDLEFEVEAYPAISGEASVEAAACVKVLMSSSLTNDSNITNRPTIVAPLTINIPNGLASHLPSDKHHSACATQNITISVSVQKLPLQAITSEGVDGNGPSSLKQPAKKKRKAWTDEEDAALMAAVDKFGEGNWQNILKEDFKHDRTAPQLSQRWAILKKRLNRSNVGTTNNPNTPALTEAQLSTRQAISRALNMPIGSLSAINSGCTPSSTPEPSPLFSPKALTQSQQALPQSAPQKMVNFPLNKPWPTQAKPLSRAKPLTGPNPLIQKAAIAAGGRIVHPSTAASLFKAAQSKNAVHIRPGGALSVSTVPVAKPSLSASTVVARSSDVGQNRMQPAVNSSVAPNSSPGSQQVTSISGKAASQPPLNNATLVHPHSQQPLGESETVVPILGDVCGNTEAKNGSAVPTSPMLEVSVPSSNPAVLLDRGVDLVATKQEKIVVKLDDDEDMDIASKDVSENVHLFAEHACGTLSDSCPQVKTNASEDLDLVIKPKLHADRNLISVVDQVTADQDLVDRKIGPLDAAGSETCSAKNEGIEVSLVYAPKRELVASSLNKEDLDTVNTILDSRDMAPELQVQRTNVRGDEDVSQQTTSSPSDVRDEAVSN